MKESVDTFGIVHIIKTDITQYQLVPIGSSVLLPDDQQVAIDRTDR